MNDLTQAWMEEEALRGDEELIVVARCGCELTGHGECGGVLYGLIGLDVVMCHQHLVLYHLWVEEANMAFSDWLDALENDTARIMYESNQESVCVDYWREI